MVSAVGAGLRPARLGAMMGSVEGRCHASPDDRINNYPDGGGPADSDAVVGGGSHTDPVGWGGLM